MSNTSERLTMQDARQVLAEQVPGLFQVLSEALGITPAALTSRIEEGDLTQLQAIAALATLANNRAQTLAKSTDMLQRLEWAKEIPASEEHDSGSACPVCGQGSIFGLRATHADGCELHAILKELGP